jgi:hypothetical protein
MLSVYLIYEISIVQGYKLTEYTWPLLAWLRDSVASLAAGARPAGRLAFALPDPVDGGQRQHPAQLCAHLFHSLSCS